MESLRDSTEELRKETGDANGQLTNVTLSADDGSMVTINRMGR